MRSLRRLLLPIAVSALLAVMSACTKDNPQVATTTGGPSASGAAPVTSNQEVRFKPGAYAYTFNGITAGLTLIGSNATLKLTNRSGAEVGAPSVYAITGDGKRVDASVKSAAPVADGGSATFDVTFPDQVDERSVGLIVLVLGQDTMGAMAPVPVGNASPSA